MEKDYIKVACPHCGGEMDIPYVYDGTYELVHKLAYTKDKHAQGDSCMGTFYVAILDGRLHVHTTKGDFQEFCNGQLDA